MPGYTTSGEAQDYNAYAALYNEYFCNSGEYSQSPADKETIFQLIDNNGDVSNVDGIGAICGYKTGTCPSQDLVDAYETVNGFGRCLRDRERADCPEPGKAVQ